MDSGVPVITVNRRLSRYLLRGYEYKKAAEAAQAPSTKGATSEGGAGGAWPTPEVMPFSSWVERLWRFGGPEVPLLSMLRSRVLFKKVVSEDTSLRRMGLVMPKEAASAAFDAYRLLNEYEARLPTDDIYLTDEARSLKRWVLEYQGELKKRGFVDAPTLAGRVAALIRQGKVRLKERGGAERVVLAGFDELTPAQRSIVEGLKAEGIVIEFWPEPPLETSGEASSELSLESSASTSQGPSNGGAAHTGINIHPFTSPETEAVWAARWVRRELAIAGGSGRRVGVIVPSLLRYRAAIVREFTLELTPEGLTPEGFHPEGFHPEGFHPEGVRGETSSPAFSSGDLFNVSLGVPLSSEPVVASAIGLLKVHAMGGARAMETNKLFDTKMLFGALCSPYFATPGERTALLALDLELRQRGVSSLSLKNLLKRGEGLWEKASQFKELDLTGFRKKLKRLCSVGNEGSNEGNQADKATDDEKTTGAGATASVPPSIRAARLVPSIWAGRFLALLQEVGWPSAGTSPNGTGVNELGEKAGGLLDTTHTLSSPEYQAVVALKSLLEDFATLDDMLGPLTVAKAVAHLSSLAKETIHQSEGGEGAISGDGSQGPGVTVQVLGLLEQAGLDFDSILILGADEDSLPAMPSPNPFIPFNIQRRYNIPGSSPERALRFSELMLGRILASAPEVVATFPVKVGGKALGPSPLLLDSGARISPAPHYEGLRLKDTLSGSLEEGRLEDVPDEGPLRIEAEELAFIKGGTSILKNQSGCPFRAFAIHRLSAVTPPEPPLGVDAKARGTVVHSALKNFWTDVKDSKRLAEITGNGTLDSHIGAAVEASVSELRGLAAHQPRAFVELERERVSTLLKRWLLLEAKRPGFTVKEIEAEQSIELGGLTITARIDRIDELDGGRSVVLDYKTGGVSASDWLGPRPRDPQLLLYNLATGFDAFAFARVRLRDTRFVGVSSEEGLLPDVPTLEKARWRKVVEGVASWDELRQMWKETLTSIAEGFIRGEHAVDPAEYPGRVTACTYCDLSSLCRIFDTQSVFD